MTTQPNEFPIMHRRLKLALVAIAAALALASLPAAAAPDGLDVARFLTIPARAVHTSTDVELRLSVTNDSAAVRTYTADVLVDGVLLNRASPFSVGAHAAVLRSITWHASSTPGQHTVRYEVRRDGILVGSGDWPLEVLA